MNNQSLKVARMKRIHLILYFLVLAVSYGYGQTFYYQAVADIDKNGAKSKATGYCYITFINNKNVCYESDEDGYKSKPLLSNPGVGSGEGNYYYRKTHEGTLVYQYKYSYTNYTGTYDSWHENFYYFSSDLNKMIRYRKIGNYEYRTEYKRASGPKNEYDDNIPIF